MEKVTIIMSVYNTPLKWFKECVNSIDKQTYENFSTIVVDDCSTNSDLHKYYGELPKNKYNVIKLSENRGISCALNTAIYSADTEFLARMDSDDIMHPKRIEIQMKYMENNPHVSVLGTGILYILEDGSPNYVQGIRHGERDRTHVRNVTKQVAKEDTWFINHPTVMYKKSDLLEVECYDISTRGYAEDYQLWVNLLNKGKIIHNIDDCLLNFRINKNSLSRKFKPDINDYYEKVRGQII